MTDDTITEYTEFNCPHCGLVDGAVFSLDTVSGVCDGLVIVIADGKLVLKENRGLGADSPRTRLRELTGRDANSSRTRLRELTPTEWHMNLYEAAFCRECGLEGSGFDFLTEFKDVKKEEVLKG